MKDQTMSCCTKNNTKEKVKDDQKTSCDSAQTDNLKTSSGEHSAEDCTDGSCKIHHGEDSEQKSNAEGCCK